MRIYTRTVAAQKEKNKKHSHKQLYSGIRKLGSTGKKTKSKWNLFFDIMRIVIRWLLGLFQNGILSDPIRNFSANLD